MKALDCQLGMDKQNAFIQCLCELSVHRGGHVPNKITLHGSLVLQNLLKFNKPIKVSSLFKVSDLIFYPTTDEGGVPLCVKTASTWLSANRLSH